MNNYLAFLDAIKDLGPKPLKDYSRGGLLLRHDVDHDLQKALKMAIIEADEGIYSTYFVLPFSYYSGAHIDLLEMCKQIQALGHEIGLHNNVLKEAINTSRPYRKVLEEHLEPLAPLHIMGTAAHGDVIVKRLGCVNYQIFQGCKPDYPIFCDPNYGIRKPPSSPRDQSRFQKKRYKRKDGLACKKRVLANTELYTICMQDYGLEYEAYFIPHDHYITDSGNAWRYHHEWHKGFLRSIIRKDIIEHINSLEDTIQMTVHPYWWDL